MKLSGSVVGRGVHILQMGCDDLRPGAGAEEGHDFFGSIFECRRHQRHRRDTEPSCHKDGCFILLMNIERAAEGAQDVGRVMEVFFRENSCPQPHDVENNLNCLPVDVIHAERPPQKGEREVMHLDVDELPRPRRRRYLRRMK